MEPSYIIVTPYKKQGTRETSESKNKKHKTREIWDKDIENFEIEDSRKRLNKQNTRESKIKGHQRQENHKTRDTRLET